MISIRRVWFLSVCLLGGCAPVSSKVDGKSPQVIMSDNQERIWSEGVTFYAKGQFLVAADLFQLSYKIKPATRISQNIGMAYLKAAQHRKYPEVLRLEYVRRALSSLKNYRLGLTNDYGRNHTDALPLREINQHITDAEKFEQELRAVVEQP